MWIVEFADGRAIPQYDPKTGKENLYREVERYSRAIVKAGWYPFTPRLARLLAAQGVQVRILPWSARAEMVFEPGDVPFIRRRCVQRVGVRTGHGVGQEVFYILGRRRGEEARAFFLDEVGRRRQPAEGGPACTPA